LKADVRAFVERIHELALEKNGEDVVGIDVEGKCSYADALIICHGRSTRQVQSIASHISSSMKQEGKQALGVEGVAQGHWVLVDFAHVVVHVFYEPVRKYYDIEGIWPDAKRIEFNSKPDKSSTAVK